MYFVYILFILLVGFLILFYIVMRMIGALFVHIKINVIFYVRYIVVLFLENYYTSGICGHVNIFNCN